MPSVSLGCVSKLATDRMDFDLVLDRVVDDRIEAAYAIVELGERDSKKGAEFPLAEEEDLDVDETEQYQQVPRSPECLRECRRGARTRNPDASPVRVAGKPLECHLPKIVHVKGAVMPTRTTGKPVQKLTLKRCHDEETVGGGIKAKLARMLIERKLSQEDVGREGSVDGITHKNDDVNDSDEEQNTVASRGRFVRTSMPILQPINVISHVQSAANSNNSFEDLAVKAEQSVSAEEIDKLRSTVREGLISEQVMLLNNSLYKNFPQAVGSQRLVEEVSNFRKIEDLRDHKICSSEVPMKDICTSSGLYCTPDSSVPQNGRDSLLSELRSASDKEVTVVKSEIEARPVVDGRYFLLRSANHSTSTSGAAGLLQYYMQPVIKSLSNPVISEFGGIRHTDGSEDDALKRLKQFSLGRDYCSETMPKGNLVPETRPCSGNVERYCQPYGSLNNVGGHYGLSDSPISEARYPLSGLIESLSLKNLTGFQGYSPKLGSSLKQVESEFVSNDSKKSQTTEDGRVRCTMQKIEPKVPKPRRKTLAIVDALEMVKGGEFGSLRTIRNLYSRLKSRNVAKSSAYLLQNTQFSELPIKTERQSSMFEEQEQVLPLDLSRCRRRASCRPVELKVEIQSSPSCTPQSFEKFPLADLCKKENYGSYSDAVVDDDVFHSYVLPVKVDDAVSSGSGDTTAKLTDDKNHESGGKHLTGSLTLSVPNNRLPPKKRKFLRQASQNSDSSESKTSSCTKSSSTHQGSSSEQNSCTYPISATSCSDENPETLRGKKISERDSKLLPDVIANEENIFSAVTVRDEDGDLPLHIAVAQGSVDIVQKLLPVMAKVGLSVDSCNNSRQTALHLAVISNQTQMVELLLSASASANVCDRKGNTAIHLAVKYKTPPVLKKLLENSRIPLDLDARNYEGLTALHIGVQLSQPRAVQALLVGGANPNAVDGTNGRTPLFNAVEACDYTAASTLVQFGSDPYIASYSGCTPLQIATGKSLREMIAILEKTGKDCWSRRIQDGN